MAVTDRTSQRALAVEPVTVPRFLERWWIADATLAVLRVAVAVLLILHGVQEHFGVFLSRGQPWLGAPAFMTDRWLAGSLELVGGLLLAAGAFTRPVALVLAMLVALSAFAASRAKGHWVYNGAELITLHTVILLAFAGIGPGLFSVDTLREGRRRPRKPGMTVPLSPWIKKQYRQRELTR